MIGQTIGNYRIDGKLGEGGMGTVYHGVDTMLDREVAIKVLKPELASNSAVVERFRTEAVNLAKLNHPNIATLYSLLREGDELYMVLEFVRGETLDMLMKRRGVLPAEEIVPVFSQVLDGIDHAHELGIVHRDLKPANLMVTERGTIKVLDFGIARLFGSDRLTRAGNIVGTLEYMPPEQVRGLETDGRSDIYSLGMVMYEALTGRVPLEHEAEFELMKMQVDVLPDPPRAWNPAIPETVNSAIMRAIQKDPDQRFQTAGDFRESLLEAGFGTKAVIHGVSGPHLAPPVTRPAISRETQVRIGGPAAAGAPPARRGFSAGYGIIAAGALLLIGIVGTMFLIGNSSTTAANNAVVANTEPVAEPATQPVVNTNAELPKNDRPATRPERPSQTRPTSTTNSSRETSNSGAVAQATPQPSPSPSPKKESGWKKALKKIIGRN